MTNEEIIQAYRDTGSVWAAAKRLGCAGQTVHKKLRAIGVEVTGSGRAWTVDEETELGRLLSEGLPMLEIANRLDRSYAGVAVRASRLGLRSDRVRKPPKPRRGLGYDKVAMSKHMTALELGEKMTPYVRRAGLRIGPFVWAMQGHFPERWEAYAKSLGLSQKECVYCSRLFWPTAGKQMYCVARCASRARTDREYFGGRRRETVGLAEGQCQLCGGKPQKGLSSHHIFGKEHDGDNMWLMALCQGCHDVVTRLAARKWVTDESALQRLIFFALARAEGARYMRLGAETLPSVLVEFEDIEVEHGE